ncbi:SET domain-containing protein 4 [Galendromus occidentalis]|uniref:SET domain-containing protein 4 n=1 Tax=Galendromus occidentalis TaxID=34638 RepID=A0AAJ6QUM3_9ACAR|nr:SET domain-containing protein 4 [Galendromus occidentalis]
MGRTRRKRKRRPRNLLSPKWIGELYSWIQRLGFKPTSVLRLACTPASGRGIVCLSNIEAGDVIIDLPSTLLITPDLVRKELNMSKENLSAEEILTIFVLSERSLGEKSKWKPYIESIPDVFDGLQCRKSVRLPRRLAQAIDRWNAERRNVFSRLRMFFRGRGIDLNFETFSWAWSAVNTRCIYVEGHGSTLAPFLDLLNHHWKASIETSFVNNHFIIRSNVGYEAGSEVFIGYGSHDNRTLFLNYGFVLDENPNDCITVELEHLEKLKRSRNIHEFARKIEFLRQNQKFTDQTGFTRDGATWNLGIVIGVLQEDDEDIWTGYLTGEATADKSDWCELLARIMLEDYSLSVPDPMAQKLLEIEENILRSLINGDAPRKTKEI